MFNYFVLDRNFLAEVPHLLKHVLVYQIHHDILKSLFYLTQIVL
jgi:hypothetical protein